ncbi:MAG: phenylalanine--tRNA ligase subunit beta [Patescibacteria group bacterium]
MKFSYTILKKLVPALKSPEHLAEILTMHLFEVEGIEGDTLDVKVLANRYSDAASHWGIAKIVSAALGKRFRTPLIAEPTIKAKRDFDLEVTTPKCRRMAARYFADVHVGPSPAWLREALEVCGMKSKNNLVDITNYVTLETGQPLHAFDFDLLADGRGIDADQRGKNSSQFSTKALIVRDAKEGEKIQALDSQHFTLTKDDIVLADKETALDIAGIRGGKKAEITTHTKQMLLTAGNFDGVSIYQTSRRIALQTDASLRFSHDLTPELVSPGIARATELIVELCNAKAGGLKEEYREKPKSTNIVFNIERLNHLTGLSMKLDEATDYLDRLGFSIGKKTKIGAQVGVPSLRTDVTIFEDLVEEIVALYGVGNIKPKAPHTMLMGMEENELIHLKDRVRHILVGFGFSEVMNYSFDSFGDIEIENPIASDKRYLRSSLERGLLGNVGSNLRFFPTVRIFEIGTVFTQGAESTKIGIAIGSRKDSMVLEMKGITESFLERFGVKGAIIAPEGKSMLRVETAGHRELGMVKLVKGADFFASELEIDLATLYSVASPEREFIAPPKYPGVTRDLSVTVREKVRVGDVLSVIREVSNLLREADVIDFYRGARLGAGNQGLTFRLNFRSDDRTLTDGEAQEEFKKIVHALEEKFDASVR